MKKITLKLSSQYNFITIPIKNNVNLHSLNTKIKYGITLQRYYGPLDHLSQFAMMIQMRILVVNIILVIEAMFKLSNSVVLLDLRTNWFGLHKYHTTNNNKNETIDEVLLIVMHNFAYMYVRI